MCYTVRKIYREMVEGAVKRMRFDYDHMDVFADRPLEGNGLAVVHCEAFFDGGTMLSLAREFKQFETIFIAGYEKGTGEARVRIFTVDGELPFAGHPLLGAAAALHGRRHADEDELTLRFLLPDKAVPTVSRRTEKGFRVQMRQGKAAFLRTLARAEAVRFAAAFGLPESDLDPSLPAEVITTGLPYLILPVCGCLERARIVVPDLAERLAPIGADYCYLLDAHALEARTWDNLGLVEDAATGSAAGPACAYLVRHGRAAAGETVVLTQGRYAHRPSVLRAWIEDGEVFVSGDAVCFASGVFALDG